MRTRVDDAVHVQIQVIHLLAIWVRFGDVDWYFLPVYLLRLFFNDGGNNLWVLGRKPSEEGWDTHRDVVPGAMPAVTTGKENPVSATCFLCAKRLIPMARLSEACVLSVRLSPVLPLLLRDVAFGFSII